MSQPTEAHPQVGETGPVLELSPTAAAARDERWHAVRRNGIGASEIAAVLGISPYLSAFALYWQKKEGWVTSETAQMRRGHRMEGVVADEWADEHPEFSMWPAGLYRHPVHTWMLASPDRLLTPLLDINGTADPGRDEMELWEGKTDADANASYDGWGTEGTDQVPVHYRAQCLWQLAVMGVPRVHLAVMFLPSWRLRVYVIEQDPGDIEVMCAAGEAFMRRLADDDPPPVDWMPTTTAALKRLHPKVEDHEVELPKYIADGYTAACKSYAAAEQRRDKASNLLRARLGAGRRATHKGQSVAVRSVYDTHRIDVTRLRHEQPALAAEYTVVSTVDKLQPLKE